MDIEWFVFIGLIGFGWAGVLASGFFKGWSWIVPTVAAGIAIAAAVHWNSAVLRRHQARAAYLQTVPQQSRPGGYVSSDTCRACHPDEHASWHRTYHRTMTQLAEGKAVRGNFDNVRLEWDGNVYQLERRGDEYWAEMPDPEWRYGQAGRPRVWRRLGLMTGSHHMQVYWVPSREGNLQMLFPFAFLFETGRWVPFHDTFLRAPEIAPVEQVWNSTCINCHSTGGQPRPNPVKRIAETRVGELGIACESCHGPAGEHVRANQDPLRRYKLRRTGEGDPTIFNPGKHAGRVSSEACGQCHSIKWIPDQKDWAENGFRYRPGLALDEHTPVVRPAHLDQQAWLRPIFQQQPRFVPDRFWPDGMVRVSGREYNGMIESACFTKGDLSCLSCHSMHRSEPADQLAHEMEGNRACLQCHEEFVGRIEQHTRHRSGSSGSECYNCHMPHTTYGLLKAIRSHWIDSPSVRVNVETGRPNACNLCHLDKPLEWTARHLQEWYGQPEIDLAEDERSVAAGVAWALKGDAGLRALTGWHMGWKPAQEASGTFWLAPHLAELLADPYSAVRYIAHRSIQTLGDFREFEYDFIGPPDLRLSAQRRVVDLWAAAARAVEGERPELLMRENGALDAPRYEALLRARDHLPMDLQE